MCGERVGQSRNKGAFARSVASSRGAHLDLRRHEAHDDELGDLREPANAAQDEQHDVKAAEADMLDGLRGRGACGCVGVGVSAATTRAHVGSNRSSREARVSTHLLSGVRLVGRDHALVGAGVATIAGGSSGGGVGHRTCAEVRVRVLGAFVRCAGCERSALWVM